MEDEESSATTVDEEETIQITAQENCSMKKANLIKMTCFC